MPLFNEIDIVTVGGVNQDLRDTYTRAAVGPTEPLGVASRAYRPHEVFFLASDRQLYETLTDISIGTTFTPEVNVKRRSISEIFYYLFSQSPDSVLNDVIGNYEKTAVASKNYHAGDLIVWTDGLYYRVTATVNQGSAWVVDTNIELEDGISTLIKKLEDGKAEKGFALTQMLNAGDTELIFTDARINSNSMIDPYTDVYGVSPKTMVQSGTSVTVTFKAQSQNVLVTLVIKEV